MDTNEKAIVLVTNSNIVEDKIDSEEIFIPYSQNQLANPKRKEIVTPTREAMNKQFEEELACIATERQNLFTAYCTSRYYSYGIKSFEEEVLNDPTITHLTHKQRNYQYRLWVDFCNEQGQPITFLDPDFILRFLTEPRIDNRKGKNGEMEFAASSRKGLSSFLRFFAKHLKNHSSIQFTPIFDLWESQYEKKLKPSLLGGVGFGNKGFMREHKHDALVRYWYEKWERYPEDLQGLRNSAMIALALASAARISDILRLKTEHVNLDDMIVRYAYGKGGTDFEVPILKYHNIIRKWFQLMQKEQRAYAFPSYWKPLHDEDGNIIRRLIKPEDEPLERWGYENSIKIAVEDLKAIGVFDESDRITTHSLRRTAISEIARKEFGLRGDLLQRFARHASFMTTKIYIEDTGLDELLVERNKIRSDKSFSILD